MYIKVLLIFMHLLLDLRSFGGKKEIELVFLLILDVFIQSTKGHCYGTPEFSVEGSKER